MGGFPAKIDQSLVFPLCYLIIKCNFTDFKAIMHKLVDQKGVAYNTNRTVPTSFLNVPEKTPPSGGAISEGVNNSACAQGGVS